MSWRVEFAPEAVAHLTALEEYIITAGAPASATRYVDAIVDYCERLQTFPERGARRDDLLPGLRITHYQGTCVIAFHVDAPRQVVSILGVFYGGQDYEGGWRDA
ncbi:type II toxin-antitoxin system RelE/ParE family toxin [Pseudoxanthomonas composti]|uniref:Type II toxin-antitoxin system RelE/ParE family toxin n=1 Tax=Pseudoxanthomonas composti TaxID=2137479 RepID=A0A4Q1JXN6_9GAMM|nr:type II toxin-antitoxin system RelE/ParE family toxin [Pseudoxanthomonas composti]RXR06560.1 type II toxin-antitoxin system RelE/ParE family toxin [Pseudoxanthomonas composti]